MLKFLKYHWFGLIISVIGLCYLAVFLLVLFAPKQDKLNRGFIPCTKSLVQEMFACTDNKAWCMSKSIVKNTWCDTKVIAHGVAAWINGSQDTPWANYYFAAEPETEQNNEEISPELQQFYDENPNIAEQMETLARQSLEPKINLEDIEDERKQPE